jgi:hypothetical protein
MTCIKGGRNKEHYSGIYGKVVKMLQQNSSGQNEVIFDEIVLYILLCGRWCI